MNQRISANIHNLTDLWKTGSEAFQSYFEQDDYAYCYIPRSQWPNRLWLTQISNSTAPAKIPPLLAVHQDPMTFSFFDTTLGDGENIFSLLAPYGISEKSMQWGMSFTPNKTFPADDQLTVQRISSATNMEGWSVNFQLAFGYCISVETLEKTADKIEYYHLVYQNENVGTLLLHQTDGVLGIHSLGIIPAMRGKGLAKKAMYWALNKAISRKARLVTLQASAMAKPMYEKLGFTSEFIMRNFHLKQ
ncbi:GNAT family N-acetyltransferase [Echinicola soli]|uniref:GNAT family N-acetyltransferase n=1 Tax=Echinicola soli TaxID=2591634 RepID=A0A514CHB9_9BACT|nr:GNAT family N-acetyltransferase [Echinicola soli]QDH79215.1 GNAT family N-acetyltransferase [Echinicola soli]